MHYLGLTSAAQCIMDNTEEIGVLVLLVNILLSDVIKKRTNEAGVVLKADPFPKLLDTFPFEKLVMLYSKCLYSNYPSTFGMKMMSSCAIIGICVPSQRAIASSTDTAESGD
uniref:Uncharacterized protein n=1 Tax=Corethron hystrix TaxID=216773 RepID=A0A7S1B8Q3_9STRA|mmetsp:Transcript_1756/g.3639  ORF Transcript_1756/g.3639 Transcript_1756/m.3639 type:complete len:112 (+) Transcript_1756:103-438(+)